MSTAVEACAARGIRVEPMQSPDPWGNTWQAAIPRRGRGVQQPLAVMLAETPEVAARAALQYVGAKGWKS
jgi:CO/xanthine dehydrogenase Mo-binding subunit